MSRPTTSRTSAERGGGRRLVITPDDVAWYTDYTGGFLGRVDPTTGRVTEVPLPGGPASLPYGMSREDNNTIRHMYFDPKTGMLWFGTD